MQIYNKDASLYYLLSLGNRKTLYFYFYDSSLAVIAADKENVARMICPESALNLNNMILNGPMDPGL